MRQTEGLKDCPGEEDEDGRDGGVWSREELRRDGDWLTFKSKGRTGIFFSLTGSYYGPGLEFAM